MTQGVAFEAVKIALKQDRNGNVLTIAVHPDETPSELWKDPIGTRYGVAIVRLDEEAAAKADSERGERVFKLAQARCRDKKFQEYVLRNKRAGVISAELPEEKARQALANIIGASSTREIRDDPVMRERFLEILNAYEQSQS